MQQLRRADISDFELTYKWASDPEIRKYSFRKNPISRSEHQIWFNRILKSSKNVLYILTSNNESVGSIRFDLEGDNYAKINYLIDTAYQRRGYGRRIIAMGLKTLKKEYPQIDRILAEVFRENIASIKTFVRLGFAVKKEDKKTILFERGIENEPD